MVSLNHHNKKNSLAFFESHRQLPEITHKRIQAHQSILEGRPYLFSLNFDAEPQPKYHMVKNQQRRS